jgi:hypothetical protein
MYAVENGFIICAEGFNDKQRTTKQNFANITELHLAI